MQSQYKLSLVGLIESVVSLDPTAKSKLIKCIIICKDIWRLLLFIGIGWILTGIYNRLLVYLSSVLLYNQLLYIV